MYTPIVFLVLALLLPEFSICLPVDSTTESFVIVGDEAQKTVGESKGEPRPPQLKSMHVTSNIRNRYGRTVVSSKYANPDDRSQEATFSINLPDTAFISGFVMEIKGKKYEAYVREKEEAKKEYQEAVAQGLGAAHVAVNARDSNKFTVSVNIEPQSKVVFNLTYEQLLVRKHGKYEMVINLNPGQLIKELKVDVHINETRKIIDVETPAIRSGNEISDPGNVKKNEYTTTNIEDKNNVHITFAPTIEQQKDMIKLLEDKDKKTDNETGISGQFVVEYDVERDPLGGEVLVNDGYFVHFFAPSDLKAIPKHVVFVLDVSGSMYGRKIEQLRQAMKIILSELNPNDYFNLVKFHSTVQVLDLSSNNTWIEVEYPQESILPNGFAATEENIKSAQDVVEEMRDEGLTNIIDALTVGLRMTSKGLPDIKQSDDKHKPQPIIVFLTDGQANIGESRPNEMIEIVKKRNDVDNKAAIFSLSFGNDANKDFLKELALKNSGFMRTIYEAADASLQLQDFYKQISSPLLTNVHFKYSDEQAKQVTKHNFDILFKGSELVVAGKLDNPSEKIVSVEGFTLDGIHKFIPRIIPILPKPEKNEEYGSLERLWAYLTIQQLLDKKYESGDSNKNNTEAENAEKEALKLALKYSFVTPVTSLVVVKPNKTDSVPEADRPVFLEESSALPLFFSAPASALGFSNKVAYQAQSQPVYLSNAALGTPGASGDSGGYGTPAPAFPPPQYLSTTHVRPTSTTPTPRISATTETDNPFRIDELPWLTPLLSDAGELTLNQKTYLIGNETTVAETKTCENAAFNISGNCTLLAQCSTIFSKLDSFETYEHYFCSLDSDKYAGVCCPESEKD